MVVKMHMQKVRKQMQAKKKDKTVKKLGVARFVNKKPKEHKMKKEKNQYQYTNFYDRLKNLDMKQGHSMEMFMTFDNLLDTQDQEEMENQLKSNFITFLRSEKMNNMTLDFKKVFNEIEPLAFSYALVVLNKKKIISKLLSYLKGSQSTDEKFNYAMATNDQVISGKVLELLIALIKDLRHDAYPEFKEQIMPHVIQVIDVQNVNVLDKVFTLFSFCFKYLLKPIREDIIEFYELFQEVLVHKNRHLRHFSAQCFSYVLRKMTVSEEIMKMIIKPILIKGKGAEELGPYQLIHVLQGISDTIFEVIYGASEDLHSKATEVLKALLELKFDESENQSRLDRMIRFLFIKLFNNIDTSKQQPLFETIHKMLLSNEQDIVLALNIFQDAIKLKYGRRLSHLSVISIVDTLSFIFTKNSALIKNFATSTLELLAGTCSYVYYFKHQSVIQIFQGSQIDISTSKSIFTYHVYKNCPIQAHQFMELFTCSTANIKADPIGLGPEVTYGSLLGLKSSNQQMEFTQESHEHKLKLLYPAFKNFICNTIAEGSHKLTERLELIALYNQIHSIVLPKREATANPDLEEALVVLEQELSQNYQKNTHAHLSDYTLHQFCRHMGVKVLALEINKKRVKFNPIRLSLDLNENFVLKNYQINKEEFSNTILTVISLQNLSYSDDIEYHTNACNELKVEHLIKNPSDILLLRNFRIKYSDFDFFFADQSALADSLSTNLCKNSREIRLETLQILKRFEKLNYVAHRNPEVEVSEFHKQDLPCDVVQLMWDFERTNIGFDNEKDKGYQLERLEVIISSGVMPQKYNDLVYNFLIGCLWIKFTPIQEQVQACVAAIFKSTDGEEREHFFKKHVKLMETMTWLSQLEDGHENETLIKHLVKSANKTRLQEESLLHKAYMKDTILEELFLEIKDFFYQLCRSISSIIGVAVLPQKKLRDPLFELFYNFLDNEYLPLHQSKGVGSGTIAERMMYANMLDSEKNKAYRRQAYSTLSSFLDMFKRSDSLRSVPRLSEFQNLLLQLLNSIDTKQQKTALECLIKSGYHHGLMTKYKKLLEGFVDDEKFKDMIPILIHGSATRSGNNDVPEEYQQDYDTEDKAVLKARRKETKSVIPKLDDEDRELMLPVIIKILQSKLLQKKGAINKKSLHVRRNIVYQFFASLNPFKEFPVFLNELLLPINISLDFSSIEEMRKQLSSVSFNTFLSFINSLEIIFKQLGTLLMQYLPSLAKILVCGVLHMSKLFMNTYKNKDDALESQEPDQQLHMGSLKQARDCFRKGLGLVKEIYRKFSHQKDFIEDFSENVYSELVHDQLALLKVQYTSEKSQLLEILCGSWADSTNTLPNYLKYSQVVPSVMEMLTHKAIGLDVSSVILTMLKRLILDTLDTDQQQIRTLKNQLAREQNDSSAGESEDQEMKDEKAFAELAQVRKQISIGLLQMHVQVVSKNIHVFWQNHVQEIKQAITSKVQRAKPTQKKNISTKDALNKQQLERSKRITGAKDLLFVQSELSNYLEIGNEINHDFLEMIVSIMGIRHIHSHSLHNEELLLFGAKSITSLIPKVSCLQEALIDKILQLFLVMNHKKARQHLAVGLQQSLSDAQVSESTRDFIVRLCKLKRGVADMELDCDSAIAAIKHFLDENANNMKNLDLSGKLYAIVFLVQHEEYSVREFAEHALNRCFEIMKTHQDVYHRNSLLQRLEDQIVGGYLQSVRDEMALKTCLRCLRSLIVFTKDYDVETRHQVKSLFAICSVKDETTDFFSNCLSIKLKERQRALKMLVKLLDEGAFTSCLKTFANVIMPLVDYQIFGGKTQQANSRDTISYAKDQKINTLDEGLAVYTSYSAQLNWSEYYRLLKKLLHKLSVAGNKQRSVSAFGAPELQKEKILTKAICRILAGFHFEEVKDAIDVLVKQNNERSGNDENVIWNSDFSDLLQKQLLESKDDIVEEMQEEPEEQNEDGEQDENIEEAEESESELEDVEMKGALTEEQVADIQSKLLNKVLPVLEKHLTETGDKKTVRSFVTVCYAKTIRKLPVAKFHTKLQKLVNLIVVNGLRSKDLSHREKARKALVKLVDEVSPKFLTIIFDEMKTQLTKGFQQHVYLFTVHALLQGLVSEGSLKPGVITKKMIDLNIEVLLSELFGDIDAEKANEQNNERKIIKESKARKAIPIFEVMTQYTDFKNSFMHLLAPIINVLEQNPGFHKIQQCEDLLSRMSTSLLKNQTVAGPQLLLFLYSIVDRGISLATKIKINDEKESRDYGAGLDKSIARRTREEQKDMNLKVEMHWKKGHQLIDNKKTKEISGRILASFGLQCFKKALKNKEIITLDEINNETRMSEKNPQQHEQLIARLDPFVILILNSFKTYHNPIVVTSLNIMTQIIGLGLPSFKELLRKFLNRIFKLFQQTQSSDSDFLNSLFKCTSELIKTYAIYQDLSDVQIKTLVEIITAHINKFAVQSNALQCLRSVVHRRFQCAELYDLIEQVQEMMVFNTNPSIRGLCSSIFIQFLLDYPLAPERVEQHINFIIKNLACKKVEGRLQLLEVLKTLLEKFPGNILDLYCELLFFTLLLRAVNDDNTNCRVQVQKVMAALVFNSKVNQAKVKTLLATVLKMGSSEPGKREMLMMAKLNAFQILVQSGSAGGNNNLKLKKEEIKSILETVHSDVIQEQVEALEEKIEELTKQQEDDDSDDVNDPEMAGFLQAIDLMSEEEQSKVIDEAEEPESDQNKPWTLLYHALSCVEKMMENQEKKIVLGVITKLRLAQNVIFFAQYHTNFWVRMICQRVLGHIFAASIENKGSNLTQMLGLDIPEQLLDFSFNLVKCLNKQVFNEEMRNQIVKNLIFMLNTLLEQKGKKPDISSLFKKISFIGRKLMLDIKTAGDRLETILQFYNVAIQLLISKNEEGETNDTLEKLCHPILELVYRTYTDDQYARGTPVKDLSIEIVELLQDNVSKPFFIETYGRVKNEIVQKRQARKMQQKQLVGTVEGMAMRANKRMKKQLKKKEKKQEKIFKDKLRH